MITNDIRQIRVCREKAININEDSYILDFGCGNGHRVYQLLDNGFKYSFGFNKGNYLERKIPVNLRHEKDSRLFRFSNDDNIPFTDNYFDLIISDHVLEHVHEQERAFREIHRVLKQGGVSVHVFPAKWQIIEPHILVPFGGLIKSFHYYWFWALLGIRNKWQIGLSAKEVAQRNFKYAKEGLNYLGCSEYQRMLSKISFKYSWEEQTYMKLSDKPKIKKLAAISETFPFISILTRVFIQRVLYLQK